MARDCVISNDINKRYNGLRRGDMEFIYNEYHKIIEMQRHKEDEILTQLNQSDPCPTEQILTKLPNLNGNKLAELARTEFYNPDVMSTLTCINHAVLNNIYYNVTDSTDVGILMDEWYTKSELIDKDSADGVVFTVNFRGYGDLLVVKHPQRVGSNDNFIHELFVGYTCTNKARKDIPNFAYMYGGFNCNRSGITYDGKGVLCGGISQSPSQYVIYENITPHISVKEYLRGITPGNYLSLMMQIILTTCYGWEKFDWTHYDLHLSNVLMRENKIEGHRKMCIRYDVNNKTYFVRSTHIATIIDFGRAHVKYNDEHFGYLLLKGEILPNESFPMFDIYKFLMLTAYVLRENRNYSALDVAETIFLFFNDIETISSALTKQRASRYNLPGYKYVKNLFKLSDLIRYIRKSMPKLFTHVVKLKKKNARYPIINCSGGVECSNTIKIYTDLGLSSQDPNIDLTVNEHFTAGCNYSPRGYVKKSYEHAKQCVTFLEQAEIVLENVIIQEDNWFNGARLRSVDDMTLYSDDWTRLTINYFNDVLLLNRTTKRIRYYIENGLRIANEYSDKESKRVYTEIKNETEFFDSVSDRVEYAKKVAQYMHTRSNRASKKYLSYVSNSNSTVAQKLLNNANQIIRCSELII